MDVLKDYNDILNAMTIEAVGNLGGVEIVERRDLLQIAKERKLIDKTKFEDLSKNQKLGIETAIPESELNKIQKDLQFYKVNATLNNAKMDVVYNPPSSSVDEKTGKVTNFPASWKVIVEAELEVFAENSDSKEIFRDTYKESYSDTLSEPPPEGSAHQYLPKAIEYCIEDAEYGLQSIIPMKTYVLATRGGKKFAMILGGKIHKIKKGRQFDLFKLPTDLEPASTVTIFQVNSEDSWGEITGNPELIFPGAEVVLRPKKFNILAKIWRFLESNLGL